jgi:MOSC domain-containing protein YiiM
VAVGDAIEPLERAAHEITVSEITRLYARDRNDLDALRRAAEVEALPESWREFFRREVEKLQA